MPLIDPALGAKLVFLLGITNIISLLLVALSCRCVGGARLSKALWKFSWYKRFYNLHCWYWRFFIASVLLHAVLAVYVFGNPL